MEQSWWLARLLEGLLVGMLLLGPNANALLLLGLLVGLLLGENDTIRSCKHHQSHSRFGYYHSSHRSSHNLVLSQAKLLLMAPAKLRLTQTKLLLVPAKLLLVLKNHFQTAQ